MEPKGWAESKGHTSEEKLELVPSTRVVMLASYQW